MRGSRTDADPARRLPGRPTAYALGGHLATVLVAGLGLLLGAGLLAGCDSAQELTGPDAGEAADALAAGLASGDLAGVSFEGSTAEEATRDYRAVVEGMGDLEPRVSAGDVREGDGTATVTLTWSWPVGGQDWSYRTRASMTEGEDAWRVSWDRALVQPDLGARATLDLTPIGARRGLIEGAGGRRLVTDRPVMRFGIDRSKVPAAKAGGSARELARLCDIDPAAYAKRVEAAGDQAFVEAITYRLGEVPDALRGLKRIPGALGLTDEMPLAPTKEFAAPILGSVGDVTAEMVQEHPDTYQAGDQAGLSGLQARYDDRLRGTPGAVVDAVAADGSEQELFRVDAERGRPLRLTLDQRLELAAERLLADTGPASALVAIRPSTGAVLAAANGPGNDGYNMATYGQLAPGSTFKSVSGLALLRAGVRPGTPVPCTATLTVDGKRFKNYSDYPSGALGDVPFRTALANSCNTAFISQADRLGQRDLVDAAASLGMGVDHDLGFPAYFGSVEPPASTTEKAADMIGQGKVLASPLTMATVVASIQNGTLVVPRLIESPDVSDAEPPAGVDPVTPSEAATMRSLLRGVVTSGSGTALLDVPGPPVIAKTGTAEFERDGKVLTHAWMVGAQGDLAVAVFVDVGSSGSGTAGPILEGFLRAARS